MDSEEAEMLANLINEFLIESYENLDQLDRDLITLEQDPTAKSTLASIFRTIHTIKGTCGFFGFGKLEAVTHVGENLLSRLRDGKLQLDAARTTGLLALVDAVRQMLNQIETTRSEGDADYTQLIAKLTALQTEAVAPTAVAAQPVASASQTFEPVRADAGWVEPELVLSQSDAPLVMLEQPTVPAAAPAPVAQAAEPAAAKAATAKAIKPAAAAGPSVADNSIRVDVGQLDVLMNLVGELVLARNQILQFAATQTDGGLSATTQRLNMITSELQESVMKTRLQPIGNIWNKFPRVVRDLAIACGKKIALEITGKETEMDKTIIEAIKDPLTHLVRNSADHGIELPDVRLQRGKPAEGHIYLRAYHEGGQVNIEISDDGAGIDPAKLKQRAQQRGLITSEQAARMSDREAINLIFLPGFSTAEKVTNISGRGVGMDVVRTNIEKIGGTLDIQSKLGAGSTIKIKIPLTLAIIPALLIASGGERFAIPQVNLLELVRLEHEQARTGIELVHGAPVYRLRGKLLPLVYLNQELQIGAGAAHTGEAAVNLVILRADERQFGLVVDAINDTEEIVVKPLSKQLKGLTTFAGATIMGDGKVALILDVMGLAQQAGVVSSVRDRALAEAETATSDEAHNRQRLLIFRLGSQGRLAMPLAQVARLEEIAAAAIERAGQQEVVQYRGQIMPLLRLAQIFGYDDQPASAAETLPVIVYSGHARAIGLVVDQIVDIAEEAVTQQHISQRAGVLGTAIIQQRVTELLDVPAIMRAHARDWDEQSAPLTEHCQAENCQLVDSPQTLLPPASVIKPVATTTQSASAPTTTLQPLF
ncbi:MAG: chemotaxis protein CheW [Acidobacteria bacterium]|nr:chemotaxis protein CheW [Acidobacteriota bacterium]MBI3426979.1 chemotaxis protein CheW [Acidobacteriota bacterium]